MGFNLILPLVMTLPVRHGFSMVPVEIDGKHRSEKNIVIVHGKL